MTATVSESEVCVLPSLLIGIETENRFPLKRLARGTKNTEVISLPFTLYVGHSEIVSKGLAARRKPIHSAARTNYPTTADWLASRSLLIGYSSHSLVRAFTFSLVTTY